MKAPVEFFLNLILTKIIVGYEFTRLNHQSGPFIIKTGQNYITYESWRLFYVYDISSFFHEVDKMDVIIQRVNEICVDLEKLNHFCSMILIHLQTNKNVMEAKDQLIMESGTEFLPEGVKLRTRRGVGDDIGNNFLREYLGIMSDQDRRKIDKVIQGMSESQLHLKNIVHEQMTFIIDSISTTSSEFNQMRQYIAELTERVNNLTTNAYWWENNQLDLHRMMLLSVFIINQHERISYQLRLLLRHALTRELSTFLPQKMLKEEILKLQKDVRTENYILGPNLADLEKLVVTKGYLYENKRLLIEIDIPLIQPQQYHLSYIVSLPAQIKGGETIIFDFNGSHFLVDPVAQEYILVTEEQIKEAVLLNNGKRIFRPGYEIFIKNNNSCESNILFNAPLELLASTCLNHKIEKGNLVISFGNNSYFVFIKNSVITRMNCKNGTTDIQRLEYSGRVDLASGCELMINNVKLVAGAVYQVSNVTEMSTSYDFSSVSLEELERFGMSRQKSEARLMQIMQPSRENDALRILATKLKDKNFQLSKIPFETEGILDKDNFWKELGYSVASLLCIILIIYCVYSHFIKSCCCRCSFLRK